MTASALVELELRTTGRCELVDITDEVADAAARMTLAGAGGLLVASPHTTAGITVNEGYDPDVARDLLWALEQMVPQEGFRHAEGNSDSHLKVALVGSSQLVPLVAGKLDLGRWQRVFFCEFDGPRTRRVTVRAI